MSEPTAAQLDLTLGVILVGFVVTGSLFGVTTAQSGWYFTHYPKDRPILKCLVSVVWALEAAHLALYFATVFIYLVHKKFLSYFEDPLPWTAKLQLLCNAFVIGLIQSFYASRIWTLSKRKLLLAVMGVFIMATWVFSIVLFVKTIMADSVADYIYFVSYDIAMNAMTASTDVLLCGALVFLLSTSRTGTEGADRLINKLMIYAVNTGLFTSLCAILSLIMVVIIPETSLYVMILLYWLSFIHGLATCHSQRPSRFTGSSGTHGGAHAA
ncbi:hypothetical protein C8Q76DRAFT_741586 [Earliella scabrosa]|nr:hypothetical protein C8Q76DRAFT_741586 [Earliella scabrosa]